MVRKDSSDCTARTQHDTALPAAALAYARQRAVEDRVGGAQRRLELHEHLGRLGDLLLEAGELRLPWWGCGCVFG